MTGRRILWPVLVTLVVCAAYVVWLLASLDWNVGRLSSLYDGYFTYYLAVDLSPAQAVRFMDIPAYRYQRILYPLLAHLLALGRAEWVPWTLLGLNLAAHALGTWAAAAWLADEGRWPGYALTYGLWVGLVVSVGLALSEPLAFALVVGALWLRRRQRPLLSAALLALALFAKETVLAFWAAAIVADLLRGRDWRSISALAMGGLAFGLWQVWLWRTFGTPGLQSGGGMASSFELIPFMGLWRIGATSLPALALFLVIFGPSIVLPTLWAAVASTLAVLRSQRAMEDWALLFNAAGIMVLPFSTFREPLGLVRFATGLVLSTLLFAAAHNHRRALNYAMLWIVLLTMLLNR